MRLIDADVLIETLRELKQSPWYNNNLNPYWRPDAKECMGVIEYFIWKEPTVEAIPVEWIKKFTEESKRHIQGSVNNYTYMYDYMLSEWKQRKEE